MYISTKGAMPTFSILKAIVGGITTTFIKWFREVQNPVISEWRFTLGPNMCYYIPMLIYIWFPEDFCCLGQTKFYIWDRVSLHGPGWLRTGLKVRLPAFASPSVGIKATTTISRSKGLFKIRQGSGIFYLFDLRCELLWVANAYSKSMSRSPKSSHPKWQPEVNLLSSTGLPSTLHPPHQGEQALLGQWSASGKHSVRGNHWPMFWNSWRILYYFSLLYLVDMIHWRHILYGW